MCACASQIEDHQRELEAELDALRGGNVGGRPKLTQSASAVVRAGSPAARGGGPLARSSLGTSNALPVSGPGPAEAPAAGQAAAGGAPGPVGAGSSSVDSMYGKNVILKFAEASLSGKTSERDAMVPALAAVLRATPAESQHLMALVRNRGLWGALKLHG